MTTTLLPRPLRLAFAGASGTGKSYLARMVADRYSVPFCPIGSRTVAADMGFASPYDVDAAGMRVEFQRRLFSTKRSWEVVHENFVTDRSTLDNLAYTTMHGGAAPMTDDEWTGYYQSLARYSAIVFLPLANFVNLDDPIRVQSMPYHRAYDALLWGLLSHAKIPVVRLETTKERRVDRVYRLADILITEGIERFPTSVLF